ncbi:hypothetical protein G4H71_03415 [Rhodococcus triatomae]|nr:hypothetical protein G4H72_04630 [Rhodococcus triatomae]QNG25501.1 hypothetical protein G4H71_03415 [Rhodococcus triatomae]
MTLSAPLALSGAAHAAPEDTAPGLADLREQTDGDQAARDAVDALAASTVLGDIAGEYTPFFYSAPTIGCGTFAPVTMTMASATTGPSAEIRADEVNFQALSAYPGVVTASGLNVAWLNTATGASGVAPLDGTTDGGYPSLAKVVPTGSGTVVASIFGSVSYTNATCHVLPTVGMFFVPEEGPLPADHVAPPEDAPA